MNLRVWAGWGLLAIAGCDTDAGGGSTDGSGGERETSSETSAPGSPPGGSTSSTGGESSSESTGSTGSSGSSEETSGSSTSTGVPPVVPPPPCGGWRTDLPAGFGGNLVLGLPDGQIAVGGAVDGLARIEFFDSEGLPVWFFDHDASGAGDGETAIIDLAAVGEDQVLGIAGGWSSNPGFVFLLDLETRDVLWNRYIDTAFVDYELGPTSYFAERGPLRVAATSEGDLAVVSGGEDWEQLHLTMGLDPLTGSRTWLDVQYATWFWSNGLVANDAAGWFTHVSSYSALGAAGHRTHRFSAETGDGVGGSGPGGAGSPGQVSGEVAVRSDGALVVPLRESTPSADTLNIVTRLPDGSSAGTLAVATEGYPAVVGSAADGADQVYMLVGTPAAPGGVQSVIRFNPDVSVDTVFTADAQTELADVATTSTDDVVVLGDDGVSFIEQLCLEWYDH